jgi:hypothetical protein
MINKAIEYTRIRSSCGYCMMCKFFIIYNNDKKYPKTCEDILIVLPDFKYIQNVRNLCIYYDRMRQFTNINKTSLKYMPEKVNCICV